MKKTVIIFFVTGVAVVYLFLLWKRQEENVIQLPRQTRDRYTFSFDEAPKNSLRGKIVSMSGDVQWTSRTATEPAKLNTGISLQQGEKVSTGTDSLLTIDFSGAATATLSASSVIDIDQALPQNLVFKQTAGSVSYGSENTALSVKALHLLAYSEKGMMKLTQDSETGTLTVKALKGEVRLGFNDLDYQSIAVTLAEGETYTYDDTTRTGSVE